MFDRDGRGAVLRPEWRADAAPHDGFDEAARWFAELPDAHPLDRAMFVDMKTWLVDDVLVKVDRATMAHGLESRAPYLDHRLVELAASVPVDWKVTLRGKKILLKRALDGHVPAPVLTRRKAGFNAPVARWLKTDLRELLRDTVGSRRAADVLHGPEVDRLCAEHDAGRVDHGHRLYNLLSLATWLNGSSPKADTSPRDRTEPTPVGV
jgi:asparagine synthase (glutamine-hydrolysing)